MKAARQLRIETGRLIIRPWTKDDLEIYRTMANDIGFTAFSLPGQFFTKNDEEILKRIHQRISLFDTTGLGKFILEDSATLEFIGTCGMEPYSLMDMDIVELAYRLRLKYWGKGLATEAAAAVIKYGLKELNLPKIHAFSLPQNAGSIKVIGKLGFNFAGEFYHAGHLHCLYLYGQGAKEKAKPSIVSLHHGQVSIPMGSEAKVREFYCNFLGLHEVQKPESLKGRGGLWLQLGDQQIHFGAEDVVDRLASTFHLGYLVTHLNKWKEKLIQAGIEPLEGIPIPGYERIEFRDPFENRIEFLEKQVD